MSRCTGLCKNGHSLAGRNVWVGMRTKWNKRLQRLVAYPKRVCRLCRRRENVDTHSLWLSGIDARIS